MYETLLTAQQVAAILQVRAVTVYAAAATGKIPVVTLWKGKRRRLLRFRRADIEKLIEQRSPRERMGQ